MDFEVLAHYANQTLTWIGFGTLVGLAAKAVMPGRDPGGTVATLMMGIAGTLIGCAILRFFYPAMDIQPISLEGFSVGAGGAFVLLLFYKILGGYWFTEGEQVSYRHRRRRRTIPTVIEE
ncbi:MAG TPA: GlsB/YeaQ/YmgE family stress response membrane protein [Pirellulaceae bacterium]|nr:GlsB/YeaQ/YmgE family stress response membrane protein [Pirellulaceae bacterium]